MGFSLDAIVKKVPSGIGNVIGGAVKSKKFLVAGGSAVAASFVFPKVAVVFVGVWLLCQTITDVVKVLKGDEGVPPVSLAERFQEGVINVIGGLAGSKKALVTGGVGLSLCATHPMWACILVAEWLLCQTAVDVALICKKRK